METFDGPSSEPASDDGPEAPNEAPRVKLVIWDLDETLWRGTLTEGPVALDPDRRRLLGELVDRGIMLSISSKNDLEPTKARLESLGIWDLFVFPRINWQPKGPQIRDLIAVAQLRAENVLFVDDLALNRADAAYHSPGLQVVDPADPGFVARMTVVAGTGKDDRARTRLAEYRILEAKAVAAETYGDDEAFLRSCEIRVAITPATTRDAERIHELILRTNQLNYTKRRIDLAGVHALLDAPDGRCLVIHVKDRFGDYGLVGFVAVRSGDVEQFTFSCRILGMGVERAVHAFIGTPPIEVVGPVSASLDGPTPDWLEIVTTLDQADQRGAIGPAQPQDVLFVGGCDLELTIAFIADRDRVATHFNYSPPDRPRLVVHRDSIDFLLSDALPARDTDTILRTVPFIDADAFATPDWARYDHVVYSPLIDFVQARYRSELVPDFWCAYGDVEAPTLTEARIDDLAARCEVPAEVVRSFATTWHPVPKPDEVWRQQLTDLFGRMARATTVTVLLGATDTHSDLDASRLETHRRANALIADVAAGFPNVSLVDVGAFTRDASDFRGSIRHYSRRVYRDIAVAISERVGQLPVSDPQRTPSLPAKRRPALWRRVPRTLRDRIARSVRA